MRILLDENMPIKINNHVACRSNCHPEINRVSLDNKHNVIIKNNMMH